MKGFFRGSRDFFNLPLYPFLMAFLTPLLAFTGLGPFVFMPFSTIHLVPFPEFPVFTFLSLLWLMIVYAFSPVGPSAAGPLSLVVGFVSLLPIESMDSIFQEAPLNPRVFRRLFRSIHYVPPPVVPFPIKIDPTRMGFLLAIQGMVYTNVPNHFSILFFSTVLNNP